MSVRVCVCEYVCDFVFVCECTCSVTRLCVEFSRRKTANFSLIFSGLFSVSSK